MQKSGIVETIAKDRINILYNLAYAEFCKNDEDSIKLGKRYVKLMFEISMHYKIEIPKVIKQKLCKKCKTILIPGLNCEVVVASSKGYISYKCKCGNELHNFYKKPILS
jgi:ribonuclease P protein subunit RPR2